MSPQPGNFTSLRDTLLTALAPCIWGSTYIVTTELLPPNHPLTTAVVRVLPVGLVMIALTRTMPKGEWWWRLMVLGLLNIGIFQALLFVAAYRLPGGVAATVIATQPLGVVILSRTLLRLRPKPLAWWAAIFGVIGVGLLVLSPAARLDTPGIIAALSGALCMALGTVLTKRWISPLPVATFTAWQLVFGGIFLLPLALIFEEPLHTLTQNNITGYLYLGVIGTGMTYALWFWGIRRLPASAVSLLGLLSPIVATLLGYLLLHQSLTVTQMIGGVLVLGSVWVGQRQAAVSA
ncbi:MAG: DMT family transporter [Pelobacteraceae bacterium]